MHLITSVYGTPERERERERDFLTVVWSMKELKSLTVICFSSSGSATDMQQTFPA